MKDYQNLYLLTDVLLLADVFENFRQSAISDHKLDPLHWIGLPGYSWNAALKHTKVELQLLTDPGQFLLIESAMRGGVSVVSHRLAEANLEPDAEGMRYFLCYQVMCNLYGYAMSQSLPQKGFEWLTEEEIANFKIEEVDESSGIGYIIECDLIYPHE
jgi:hypothetical protein